MRQNRLRQSAEMEWLRWEKSATAAGKKNVTRSAAIRRYRLGEMIKTHSVILNAFYTIDT